MYRRFILGLKLHLLSDVKIFLDFPAPSIYENEDIKKGILLQLFGGTRKDFTNTGRGKFRLATYCFGLHVFQIYFVRF